MQFSSTGIWSGWRPERRRAVPSLNRGKERRENPVHQATVQSQERLVDDPPGVRRLDESALAVRFRLR